MGSRPTVTSQLCTAVGGNSHRKEGFLGNIATSEEIDTGRATNCRWWWNNRWKVVETAGSRMRATRRRQRWSGYALVERAHAARSTITAHVDYLADQYELLAKKIRQTNLGDNPSTYTSDCGPGFQYAREKLCPMHGWAPNAPASRSWESRDSASPLKKH